jgi:hypothetical protein
VCLRSQREALSPELNPQNRRRKEECSDTVLDLAES